MADIKHQLKKKILSAISEVEKGFKKGKLSIKDKLNLIEPLMIMPYYGFGNENYVFIKGRVLENEKITEKSEGGSDLEHLKDTFKRYESDEIPNILVRGSFAGQVQEKETDDEGFFEFEFRFDEPINYESHGKEVQLKLLETKTDDDDTEARGKIFVPGENSEYGIISDIDDTVLVSKVTHFLPKLKLMLLEDSSERSPFPGIAAFLRALTKGSDGKGDNPVFYVSGSEWNLFDLLVNFFRFHDIPQGPLLLRDKGSQFDRGSFETGESNYKIKKIRHILKTYPDLNFICIGDSGQEDPEIYQKVIKEFPGRILGIYVRDVTPEKRDKEVHKIADEVKAKGPEMELVEETYSAAKHASGMNWINEDQLATIKKECEQDQKKKKD